MLGVSGHGTILAPHARLLPSVIGEMQALRDQFRELPPGSAVRVWVPVRLNVVVNVIGHGGREPLYRRRGRQPHRRPWMRSRDGRPPGVPSDGTVINLALLLSPTPVQGHLQALKVGIQSSKIDLILLEPLT